MSNSTVKLSVALIVRNEARCLARCLKSIQGLAPEIVVVDTGSTDETVSIARQFEAKISTFAWVDDFSAARNFALEQATGNWILVLDADEHASEELVKQIATFIAGPRAIGRLKIVSDFRRNGQVFRSACRVSRLFPRGLQFEGRIHEQLVSTLPRLDLKGDLWHDGYLDAQKSDRNVKLLLAELQKQPDDTYLMFQLALEYAALNQAQKAGEWLGKAYSGVSLNEPFAPNLVVDYLYALNELKQYETGLAVIQKASGALQDFPDFHLACGLFYMNLVRSNAAKYVSYLPEIEESFKRSLAVGETDKYKSVRGSGTFLAQYNLGTLYHVFGNEARAKQCFEEAAKVGYGPARQMLERLSQGKVKAV